jgi:antitoxin component of RelBE/YafQ-DinJ toxin-antitoxin module
MKNITVTVNEEIYHKARVCAAERKSTISALVKDFLTKIVEEESIFERMKREEDELRQNMRQEGFIFSAEDRCSREDLHDRHAIR